MTNITPKFPSPRLPSMAEQFPGTEGVTYLDTAARSLLPLAAKMAVENHLDDRLLERADETIKDNTPLIQYWRRGRQPPGTAPGLPPGRRAPSSQPCKPMLRDCARGVDLREPRRPQRGCTCQQFSIGSPAGNGTVIFFDKDRDTSPRINAK